MILLNTILLVLFLKLLLDTAWPSHFRVSLATSRDGLSRDLLAKHPRKYGGRTYVPFLFLCDRYALITSDLPEISSKMGLWLTLYAEEITGVPMRYFHLLRMPVTFQGVERFIATGASRESVARLWRSWKERKPDLGKAEEPGDPKDVLVVCGSPSLLPHIRQFLERRYPEGSYHLTDEEGSGDQYKRTVHVMQDPAYDLLHEYLALPPIFHMSFAEYLHLRHAFNTETPYDRAAAVAQDLADASVDRGIMMLDVDDIFSGSAEAIMELDVAMGGGPPEAPHHVMLPSRPPRARRKTRMLRTARRFAARNVLLFEQGLTWGRVKAIAML